MITCTKCKVAQSLDNYQKDSNSKSGFRSTCKTCSYAATIEWNRSPKGIACRLWHKHNRRSIHRGHDKPGYTKEWLFNFVLNHPDFDSLYAAYVSSGYNKYFAPSIDRLDDNVGYTKDNIRLVAFIDNMEHAWDAGRKKEYHNAGWAKGACGDHRAVVQLSMAGEFVAQYISVSEACRQVGAQDSKISNSCSGKRKSHAGFRWMYLDDYEKAGRKVPELKRFSDGGKKKVGQYTLNGDFVSLHESTVDAGNSMGVSSGAIAYAARESKKSCGYYWRYCSD